MTDTELKDFAEAVKRLDEVYATYPSSLEVTVNPRPLQDRFCASVQVGGSCKFGHADTAMGAVANLIESAGDGICIRTNAAASLRQKIENAARELAQLEAQSV